MQPRKWPTQVKEFRKLSGFSYKDISSIFYIKADSPKEATVVSRCVRIWKEIQYKI